MQKANLKKINDYLWEIPQSFRVDMRVPARVYANETMLEKVFQDRSLGQLVNVATLPGIVDYALAMPDMHEGYGFPIGGVAAMRMEDGIISPGGVGYDISCLPGDVSILHSLGYSLPIEEFEQNFQNSSIQCGSFSERKIDDTSIRYFMKRKVNPTIYEINTLTEEKIRATSDHPFYTPKGMVELARLKPGDKIALYPFKGVNFKEVEEKILADENKIREIAIVLGKDSRGHGLEQIINQLKKRNFLPLKTNSSQFPHLLKVMGYVLGDGTIYFMNKRGKGFVWFYGKSGDLKRIRKDIKKIGWQPSEIYFRKRKHEITTYYASYKFSTIEASFKVTSSSFALLLLALGVPLGNKSKQPYLLPAWLFKLPLWQKRLFLASFFGAELSSPRVITKHGFNFNIPVLGLNKSEKYVANGRRFLMQIAKILEEFGVKKRKIIHRKDYKNQKNESSYRIRLSLASDPQSLINLWSKIGYEYNQERQFLANLAVHFIKSKQKFIEKKILARGIKARRGLIKFKKSQLKSLRKLIAKGGRNLARPFVGHFPVFKEFMKETTKGLGRSGMVWDEIVKIKKAPFKDYVYDFTVNHPDHNFIANNFVVSNCGVRVVRSEIFVKDLQPHLGKLMDGIYQGVPSGVGRGGKIKLNPESMRQVLEKGVSFVVEKGYGTKEDIEHCEENGTMAGAEAIAVSERAKARGRDQLGTLGSGNHFLEIQKVDKVFDAKIAETFGLKKDLITVMIHSGSRGLGHQVCTDYVKIMHQALSKYKIRLSDPELACAPLSSPEGKKYFSAMAASSNFAWANRQLIMHLVRQIWQNILGKTGEGLRLIYDVAHNIAKLEKHQGMKLCVHRKGATRAFGPAREEVPKVCQEIGQPVLIPGTMGTASYILIGTKEAENQTFASVCHGAGRVMSRHAAIRSIQGNKLRQDLEKEGIVVRCLSSRGLAEEAPLAYKDIHNVVDVVVKAGLAKLVARLKPLGVLKG